MNILLANIDLVGYGGTESWIETMANALTILGHTIYITSDGFGPFSQQNLSQYKLVEINEIPHEIDFAIINHKPLLIKLRDKPFPKIYVSHGVFDDVGRCDIGANYYVCVSPEIQRLEEGLGFSCDIIGNPVNTSRFTNKTPIHDTLTNVLLLSKGLSLAKPVVQQACNHLGVAFIHQEQEVFEVEDLINRADLVIGIGRCLIESMMCGRNVISADYRDWMTGFEGFGTIDETNFNEAWTSHYSGRKNPKQFTAELLIEELKKYRRNRGGKIQQLAMKHHDYITVAKQFLDIYDRIK